MSRPPAARTATNRGAPRTDAAGRPADAATRPDAEIAHQPAGIVDSLRRQIGHAVRERVAGSEPDERAARIWAAPGERWFAVDSPISRVHGASSMYAGGVAALLLQALHPGAMAGVAGHSGFRGDPWGRLQRTGEYIAMTTFGPVEGAEAMIDRVRRIHATIRGTDHRGRPYRASDPNLLRWVHDAETLSFYSAYQRFSGTPLTPLEADEYVEQASLSAELLGATRLPLTLRELRDQIQDYRSDLELSPAAADVVQFLLHEPPLPVGARAGYSLLALGGVSVLPPWARDMLGIRLPGPAAAGGRAVGRAATGLVDWAMAGIRPRRAA